MKGVQKILGIAFLLSSVFITYATMPWEHRGPLGPIGPLTCVEDLPAGGYLLTFTDDEGYKSSLYLKPAIDNQPNSSSQCSTLIDGKPCGKNLCKASVAFQKGRMVSAVDIFACLECAKEQVLKEAQRRAAEHSPEKCSALIEGKLCGKKVGRAVFKHNGALHTVVSVGRCPACTKKESIEDERKTAAAKKANPDYGKLCVCKFGSRDSFSIHSWGNGSQFSLKSQPILRHTGIVKFRLPNSGKNTEAFSFSFKDETFSKRYLVFNKSQNEGKTFFFCSQKCFESSDLTKYGICDAEYEFVAESLRMSRNAKAEDLVNGKVDGAKYYFAQKRTYDGMPAVKVTEVEWCYANREKTEFKAVATTTYWRAKDYAGKLSR